MSFFQTAFRCALRAQLSSGRTWLLILLLPLVTFGAARLLPAQEASAPVQVGVVLPEKGGGDFWRRLEARSGLAVTFHTAGRAEAEGQVAAGRWDCALVLPEDFEARLERLEVQNLFTLLVGPGSVVYPMVQETVTACAAECLSPGMAEAYLLSSGIAAEEELEAVRSQLHEVLKEQDRVLVAMETADGRPLDPLVLADSGVNELLSGLTAILLLIWVLLAAMDLGRWLDSPFARRLAPTGRDLLLPRLAAALVPALCAGTLALLALDRPLACIAALVPYLLFWGGAALILARARPVWSTLPVLVPFVPALSLLLSPMLADLSGLFPVLAPVIRWNPVTLYLRACGGRWGDGLILAGAGVLLLTLRGCLDRRKNSPPASGDCC